MSDKVIKAFGIHGRMTVDQVLEAAKEGDLSNVLVSGYHKDGGVFFCVASDMGRHEALFLNKLAECRIVGIPVGQHD